MSPTREMLDAVKTGNSERVKSLLAADSTLVNARDDTGDSALLVSLYYGRKEITDILLSGAPRISFFEAAALGNVARMWELLKHYRELVTSYSHDGFTALHLAAFFGREEIVELLLEHHADINAAARNQAVAARATPLHSAVARGNTRIVALLLNAGAAVNVRQQGGYTPLHAAALAGSEDIVRLLLQHGADTRLRTDAGKTALALAGEKKNTVIVELLRHHEQQRPA